jgi:polyisoprenoid-binding protein YceI
VLLGLDGRLSLDHDDGCAFELTLQAASLDTGNRRRDEHLRSADFFDAAHHPVVRFTTTQVSDAGHDGRVRVEGTLEAAGNRVPLVFEATFIQDTDRLDLTAVTQIDQRRLGRTRWRPSNARRVEVSIHASLASVFR